LSSRIWLCPGCGQLGHHADLPADTVQRLLLSWIGPVQIPEATQVRAAWCSRCESPYLVMHQEDVPRDERLQSVGYAVDLIESLKGGKRP
jgi:hypothetical protein